VSPKKRAPASRSKDHVPVLFTGFPGFIGERLLPRLAELRPEVRFVCLVQEKFLDMARTSSQALEQAHPHLIGRVELLVGDITQPGLGLATKTAHALQRELVGAYHLAALYDLSVAREIAMRVNVEGTRNVLELLGEAKNVARLDYVSTAYVSGTAVGKFRETDLDVGQKFKNYYEETKFLAEVSVVESGIPYAIYRPGIVVGDSYTGVTAKFDGPYFALNAIRHLPSPGVFMKVGSGTAKVNLVPVDYVLEAMARLSSWDGAVGKTYHLTDPDPLSALELEELLSRALGKSFVYLPVPLPIAKLLFAPKKIQQLFGMPSQTLDYFDHPVEYDSTQAVHDLKKFGVSCPRFSDYAQTLIRYYLQKVNEGKRGAMA
jgi:thioester reductase-like protein